MDRTPGKHAAFESQVHLWGASRFNGIIPSLGVPTATKCLGLDMAIVPKWGKAPHNRRYYVEKFIAVSRPVHNMRWHRVSKFLLICTQCGLILGRLIPLPINHVILQSASLSGQSTAPQRLAGVLRAWISFDARTGNRGLDWHPGAQSFACPGQNPLRSHPQPPHTTLQFSFLSSCPVRDD